VAPNTIRGGTPPSIVDCAALLKDWLRPVYISSHVQTAFIGCAFDQSDSGDIERRHQVKISHLQLRRT